MLQQYTRLQQELAASDVLELPAGVPYLLRSSAVLLKGTLKVSGRPYVEGKKGRKSPSYFPSHCPPFPSSAPPPSLCTLILTRLGLPDPQQMLAVLCSPGTTLSRFLVGTTARVVERRPCLSWGHPHTSAGLV